MEKDYKAVDELYNEIQSTEHRYVHIANQYRPNIWINNGFIFEINHTGKFAKHDINLVHISANRVKSVIARIEFEYGKNQHDWDYEIPWKEEVKGNWTAINLMFRKKYGENFDVFVKASPTYRSFFLIDCRDDFVKRITENQISQVNHNLGFETNDEIYRLEYNVVQKNIFYDNPKLKKWGGDICVSEDNEYNVNYIRMYKFYHRKFIEPFIIKNNLKLQTK